MRNHLIALTVSLFAAAPAAAATLVTSGAGVQSVVGAKDVNVSGTLYDVEFLDGTCGDLFGGCDAASDFAFTTSTDARAAAEALVAQVFPLVGSWPNDVRGCNVSGVAGCQVMVPFGLPADGLIYLERHTAQIASSGFQVFASQNSFLIAEDTTTFNNYTYARFSVTASPIPIPAAAPLLLAALGGLALLRRRAGSHR